MEHAIIMVATPLTSKCIVQFTYFNWSQGPEARFTEGIMVEISNSALRFEMREEITAIAAKMTNSEVMPMKV